MSFREKQTKIETIQVKEVTDRIGIVAFKLVAQRNSVELPEEAQPAAKTAKCVVLPSSEEKETERKTGIRSIPFTSRDYYTYSKNGRVWCVGTRNGSKQ